MLILFEDNPELHELYAELSPVDFACIGIYVNSGKCWWVGKNREIGRRLWDIYERALDKTYKKILEFLKENYPEALI